MMLLTEKRVIFVVSVAFIGGGIYKGGLGWLVVPTGVFGLLSTTLSDQTFEAVPNIVRRLFDLLIPDPPIHRWLAESSTGASYRSLSKKSPGLAAFYVILFSGACSLFMPKLLPQPQAAHYGWGLAAQGIFVAYVSYAFVRANYPVERWGRALLKIVVVASVLGIWIDQDPIWPHVLQTLTRLDSTNLERAVVVMNEIVVILFGVIIGTIAGPLKEQPSDAERI